MAGLARMCLRHVLHGLPSSYVSYDMFFMAQLLRVYDMYKYGSLVSGMNVTCTNVTRLQQ